MNRSLADISTKIAGILLLASLAYLGEHGADGGFIKDMWAQAKLASPFAAMLAILAWLDERRERREAQRQCNERTIDFINTVNVAARALEKVANSRKGR